ncbi:MAG: hypothetical protein DRP56_08735 [Planctomycetota bacterium]|nr:MAG: hypothetical protein DRP56_08735 [Planctomycetota bacterium]
MDPNQKNRIVLECDAGKDPAPCFVYPFLTGRQQRLLMDDYEKIDNSGSHSENLDRTFKTAAKFLTGWENITGPDGSVVVFDRATLEDVVSVLEAMELINKLFLQQKMSFDDKKKRP